MNRVKEICDQKITKPSTIFHKAIYKRDFLWYNRLSNVVFFWRKGFNRMDIKEFFGIGGYERTPEGYMSWQHLTFVTTLMVIMVACAIFFGRTARRRGAPYNNRVLIISAFLLII